MFIINQLIRDSDNCFICRFIYLIVQCCCSPADWRFLKLLLNENAIGLYWSETSLKSFQLNGLWWCWMLSSEMFLSKLCFKPQDRLSMVSFNCSALACVCECVLLVHGKYFIFCEILAVLPMTVLPRHWPVFPFGNPCPEKVFEMLLLVMCMERRHFE